MTKKLTAAVILSSTLLLSVQQATANSYNRLRLTFDNVAGQQNNGTVSYGSVGGSFVGTGIEFDTINATGQVANSSGMVITSDPLASLDIQYGTLGFNTGNLINDTTDASGTRTLVFGSDTPNMSGTFPVVDATTPVTSFDLEGTIWDGTDQVYSGSILTGNFVNFGGNPQVSGSNSEYEFSATGITSIAPELLEFYGLEGQFSTFTNNLIELNITTTDPNGTFSGVVDGDSESDLVTYSVVLEISNSSVNSSGTTISMLGISLFCLGFVRRVFSRK